MTLKFTIETSERLAIRNPESTTLGRKIVRSGLILMEDIGYEHFTFRKLAENIQTTEASIYRYFENKHKLLLYYLSWYWNITEYGIVFHLQNIQDPALRIKKTIEILTNSLPNWSAITDLDQRAMLNISMMESRKAYFLKEVDDLNKEKLFKPYKDLTAKVAQIFIAFAPTYPYPHSLASSIIELAQSQPYFSEHLPSLTDFTKENNQQNTLTFLEMLIFSALTPFATENT
jgi:AcrR family transcriptional regulator